jgi:hypothetical protein
MAATQKCERLAQAILDEAAFRCPAYTFVKSYDADSNILFTITGTGIATSYILILPEAAPASGATDGLGLTQRVYTPDVIRFGYDSSAAFEAAFANFALFHILALKGTAVEVYVSATIAASDLRAGPSNGNYKGVIRDLQWGFLSQQ